MANLATKAAVEEGILPGTLQILWEARDAAKRRGDPQASFAIKILMNSFFGALASPNSRFFNMDVANAITHYGQYLIKMTAERIEKRGYKVIYGDTDSLFVLAGTDNYEEALSIGKKLEKETNEFYQKFIKKEYKRKCAIKKFMI